MAQWAGKNKKKLGIIILSVEGDIFLPLAWVGNLAKVNQQPPMHQLRMRPLKPFWG